MSAKFSPGKNIAMKVPYHQYEATVRFYREILGFEPVTGPSGNATGFKFGDKNLWIDNVLGMSQAEIWLEVVTNNTVEAARILERPASPVVMKSRVSARNSTGSGFPALRQSST